MASIPWSDLQRTAEEGTRPVPVGDYRVEIVSAKATIASTGAEMIKVSLKILDGPHAGRTLLNQFVLSPDNPFALKIFFRHMAALGISDVATVAPNGMEQLAEALLHRVAYATVSIGEWQGVSRNQVDNIKSGPGSGPAGSATSGPVPGAARATSTAPTPRVAPPSPSVPASSPSQPPRPAQSPQPGTPSGAPSTPPPPPVPAF